MQKASSNTTPPQNAQMPILQSNQKTAARGGKSSKTIRGNERVGEERLPPQKDRARQHVSSEQKSNAKQKTNTGKPENQTTKHKPNKPQNQSQTNDQTSKRATKNPPKRATKSPKPNAKRKTQCSCGANSPRNPLFSRMQAMRIRCASMSSAE